jgi:hypothetical protein
MAASVSLTPNNLPARGEIPKITTPPSALAIPINVAAIEDKGTSSGKQCKDGPKPPESRVRISAELSANSNLAISFLTRI